MAVAHTPPPHAHQASPEHLASGDREALNSPISDSARKAVASRALLYAIPVLTILALVMYLFMGSSRMGPSPANDVSTGFSSSPASGPPPSAGR